MLRDEAKLPDSLDRLTEEPKAIAVVIPTYNEREHVEKLFQRFRDLACRTPFTWRLIFVDDGSTDGTVESLIQVFSQRVKGLDCRILELSRNFGKEAAMAIGFEAADCELVATVDADLQDPPELIPQMLETMRATGADVVCGKRKTREGESLPHRIGAYLYYRITRYISDASPDVDVGDFRLMRRQVVEALGRFPERSRFMKSIYVVAGFRRVAFPYDRKPRAGRKAKLSIRSLTGLAVDGIASLSITPLRIGTYLGLIIFSLALFYSIFLIAQVMIKGIVVSGYASIMVVLLMLNGIQFLLLGLFGEYLGRALIKLGAKMVTHARYTTFQMAEVNRVASTVQGYS